MANERVRFDSVGRESPFPNDGPVMVARDQVAVDERAGSGKKSAGFERLDHNAGVAVARLFHSRIVPRSRRGLPGVCFRNVSGWVC